MERLRSPDLRGTAREREFQETDSRAYLRSKTVQPMGGSSLANIKKLQKGNKILPIIIGKIKIPFELQDTAYIRCMSVTPNIAFQIVRGLLKNEHEDWEKAKDYVLIDVITNIEKYESNLKDHDGRSIIMHYKFKRKVMNTIQEVLGKDHAVFYKTIIYDENKNIVNGREGSFTYAKSILNELVLCGALELMAGEMGTSYSVSPNYTSIVKNNWKLWLKSRGIG